MERITAADNRISTLSALLDRPPAVGSHGSAATPDPRGLLEQEREQMLEEARQAGYMLGIKRADDEIRELTQKVEKRIEEANAVERERLLSANKQMRELLRAVPQAIADVDTRLNDLVTEAAFASVLRVLGEAAATGSLIRDICRQALDEYRQRPVVLRVAAADADAVTDLAEADLVRVMADPRLHAGQCRLETHKGIYNTSLETRLDGLKQAFLRSLNSEVPCK